MFKPDLPISIKHVQSNKHVFVHDANGFYLFQCQDWQIAEYIVTTVNNKSAEAERLENTIAELEEKIEDLKDTLRLSQPESDNETSPFISNQNNGSNPQSHLG